MTATPDITAPLHREAKPSLQSIEYSASFQIPGFQIVGLAAREIDEARERVRAAILAAQFEFPRKRVLINLSPASVQKSGTGLDFAIALKIMTSEERFANPPASICASAELSLQGRLQPVGRPTRSLAAAWASGVEELWLAEADAVWARKAVAFLQASSRFASLPPLIRGFKDLHEVLVHLRENPRRRRSENFDTPEARPEVLAEKIEPLLRLSPSLERVLCAAASGAHHVLLLGPKGIGKSYALKYLEALIPAPPIDAQIDQRWLAELASLVALENGSSLCRTPIRRVGPTVRPQALLGSVWSQQIVPGEFTLAHGGLLIADELPEWSRDSREVLRIPLEERVLELTRAQRQVRLPARFMLAATGNLCPCGNEPSAISKKKCLCSSHAKKLYASRLSGPLLDRMDWVIQGWAPCSSSENLMSAVELSALQARVLATRNQLLSQWGEAPGDLSAEKIEKIFSAHPKLLHLTERWIEQGMTLRSRHKILKMSLTLAAWDQLSFPDSSHLEEARFYRIADSQGEC